MIAWGVTMIFSVPHKPVTSLTGAPDRVGKNGPASEASASSERSSSGWGFAWLRSHAGHASVTAGKDRQPSSPPVTPGRAGAPSTPASPLLSGVTGRGGVSIPAIRPVRFFRRLIGPGASKTPGLFFIGAGRVRQDVAQHVRQFTPCDFTASRSDEGLSHRSVDKCITSYAGFITA